jgi:hypothetical protein
MIVVVSRKEKRKFNFCVKSDNDKKEFIEKFNSLGSIYIDNKEYIEQLEGFVDDYYKSKNDEEFFKIKRTKNKSMIKNTSNDSPKSKTGSVVEKPKTETLDMYSSKEAATKQMFTNFSVMKMMILPENGEYTQKLYTMEFDTIIEHFSKEFEIFLKTIYNDKEW